MTRNMVRETIIFRRDRLGIALNRQELQIDSTARELERFRFGADAYRLELDQLDKWLAANGGPPTMDEVAAIAELPTRNL